MPKQIDRESHRVVEGNEREQFPSDESVLCILGAISRTPVTGRLSCVSHALSSLAGPVAWLLAIFAKIVVLVGTRGNG